MDVNVQMLLCKYPSFLVYFHHFSICHCTFLFVFWFHTDLFRTCNLYAHFLSLTTSTESF